MLQSKQRSPNPAESGIRDAGMPTEKRDAPRPLSALASCITFHSSRFTRPRSHGHSQSAFRPHEFVTGAADGGATVSPDVADTGPS